MIYTELTKKAMKYLFLVQGAQKDLSGIPYVFHPWHLAETMEDELSTTVALLHDVMEDSGVAPEDLRAEGFPDSVVEVLVLLTRREDENYRQYIERLADNPVARKVKLADLSHNMDTTRLDAVTEKDRKRLAVYIPAKKYLEEMEARAIEGI